MFDRFDVCEAYYCYATLYHGGQGSREYALFATFHRIRFECRDSATHNPDELTDNGRMIFDALVASQGAAIRDRR